MLLLARPTEGRADPDCRSRVRAALVTCFIEVLVAMFSCQSVCVYGEEETGSIKRQLDML